MFPRRICGNEEAAGGWYAGSGDMEQESGTHRGLLVVYIFCTVNKTHCHHYQSPAFGSSFPSSPRAASAAVTLFLLLLLHLQIKNYNVVKEKESLHAVKKCLTCGGGNILDLSLNFEESKNNLKILKSLFFGSLYKACTRIEKKKITLQHLWFIAS